VNLDTFEIGVTAWIAAVTGVAAGRIWWERQGISRPTTAGAWITCSILSSNGVGGMDWKSWAPNPLVLAADVVEAVAPATDRLTLTAHAYQRGDGPVRISSSGTAPAGLATGVDYWVIVVDANTIQLAASYYDARAGVPVNVTDAGSGTHSIVCTAATVRTGQEILHKQEGHRRAIVSIQCFGAGAVGGSSNEAVLERMRSKRLLPASRLALKTHNLGIEGIGTVQGLGEELNKAAFEPRAVCEVTFSAVSSESEAGSRIDFVKSTNTETGDEVWSPSNPLA